MSRCFRQQQRGWGCRCRAYDGRDRGQGAAAVLATVAGLDDLSRGLCLWTGPSSDSCCPVLRHLLFPNRRHPNRAGGAGRCFGDSAPSAAPVVAVTIDPDAIGPDGTVRLRCYLPSVYTVWFSAGCKGQAGCGHVAPIGIRAAIRLMGSGEATVRQLERRLRCSQCVGRRVSIVLQPDTRPPAVRKSEGPRPETRAGMLG